MTLLFEGNPLTHGHEILSLKTRVLGAAHSKDFVILACTVLIQITSVTAVSYTHLTLPTKRIV